MPNGWRIRQSRGWSTPMPGIMHPVVDVSPTRPQFSLSGVDSGSEGAGSVGAAASAGPNRTHSPELHS
jgi:hypothetical protein